MMDFLTTPQLMALGIPAARILERGEFSARLQIDIRPDTPAFDGHFDGAPILPGVAQIDWAIRLARLLFKFDGDFIGMDVVKFQQVVTPGMLVTLELKFDPQQQRLHYQFHSSAGTHASGRIQFGPAT